MKYKPYPPTEPRKPSKIEQKNIYIDYKNPISSLTINLADVKVPEGCELKDAIIDVMVDGSDLQYEFIFTKQEENCNFDEQMKQYNEIYYPEYLTVLENYKIKLAKWEKEQEEIKAQLLKNQLDQAEALLKKYGRL